MQASSSASSEPVSAATNASGTPDPAEVERGALQRLVDGGMERLRPCYRRELGQDPDLEQKMAIVLYVTPSGKVADGALRDAYDDGEPLRKATLLNDKIGQCLDTEIMSWNFPATSWEGEVQLTKPPVFIVRFGAKPIALDSAEADRASLENKEKVRQVIHARYGEFGVCYEAFRSRGGASDRKIKVKVQLVVGREGLVTKATVLEPAVLEPQFGDCLLGVLRSLSFGRLQSPGGTVVEYPLVFVPSR